MKKKQLSRETLMRLASYASIVVALTLIVVKLCAFWATNSLAMLSSLFDSGLDLGASVVSLIAIHQALVPADHDHRFGHGKAEAVGSLTQGLIIAASGVFLLCETVRHLMHPIPLERLDVGLGVMIFAICLTCGLIAFQRFVIARTKSLSIYADSAHYTGDIMMNVGVMASMGFSYVLKWQWVDSLFAVVVAGYLFWMAFRITHSAGQILMDKELPLSVRRRIQKIAMSHPEINSIHDLRTRKSGLHTFIQFHAEMRGGLTLEKTHQVCETLEQEIGLAIPDSETFIHQEPIE